MTFYIENETEAEFPFPVRETAEAVIKEALETEHCPYEVQVSLLLTDNEGIRQYNREYREIDRPTDVLSFPNLDFAFPADFQMAEEQAADCFDMESGELLLGDIIVSAEKVKEQAKAYGHSEKREFAFLIAHSMLHLCGYDHMQPQEAADMDEKQEQILSHIGITRE